MFLVFALFVWLWGVRRGLIAMLVSTLVFLLTFAPYTPAGAAGIIENVLLYGGVSGGYGLTMLFPARLVVVVLVVAMALVVGFYRPPRLVDFLLAVVLTWLVAAPGFGIQYLYLPMLLGIMDVRRYYGWVLALSYGVFAGELYLLQWRPEFVPINTGISALLWLTCALWLATLLRRRTDWNKSLSVPPP